MLTARTPGLISVIACVVPTTAFAQSAYKERATGTKPGGDAIVPPGWKGELSEASRGSMSIPTRPGFGGGCDHSILRL